MVDVVVMKIQYLGHVSVSHTNRHLGYFPFTANSVCDISWNSCLWSPHMISLYINLQLLHFHVKGHQKLFHVLHVLLGELATLVPPGVLASVGQFVASSEIQGKYEYFDKIY